MAQQRGRAKTRGTRSQTQTQSKLKVKAKKGAETTEAKKTSRPRSQQLQRKDSDYSSINSTSPSEAEIKSDTSSDGDSGRDSSSDRSRSPSTSPTRSSSAKTVRPPPTRRSARISKMMEIDEDFKPPALKQQNVSENGVSSISSSENGRKKHKRKHKHHKKDRDKERSHHDRDRDHHSHSHKEESKKRKASHSSDDEVPLLDRKKVKTESDDEVPLVSRKQSQASDDDDDVPLSNRKIVKEESDDDVPLSSRKTAQASDSDDDVPLSARKIKKEDSDDEIPLSQRKKVKTEHKPKAKAKVKREPSSESDDEYERRKKQKKKSSSSSSNNKKPSSSSSSPTKSPKKKVKEEEEEVWRWWEEDRRDDGVKWTFLEHKGPLFAPDYEPLPKSVHFKYAGKPMKLSQDTEEVAGFYARLIEHDYTTKEKFNTNFWKDWRKVMTKEEREVIVDLKKCDFSEINEHYKQRSEERKNMSKEEKNKIKEEKEQIQKEYGYCIIDGHKEKIGNFNIEPPGLFRGRGEHPKMGMLKKRVMPEDVVINCSKDSKIPTPPKGHKWKEVRHNNTASWLAGWTENVQGQQKYVMLNVTSRLKGEKDWLKYEKARELAKHIDKIRRKYTEDFKHKEMRVRQRAVALYFIDRLALRAGNEKDEDQADTVGCCSLRVEHVELHEKKNIDNEDKEWVVVFDFLGKDSIRYFNQVPVEKRVFKNLKHFMENKRKGDDLFDRLNTTILNEHLKSLMDGLSAKVFRTYNASHTLQQQLDELTQKTGSVAEKVLAYNRANRAVAILCNHQRAPPKSHEKSMENLEGKIDAKKKEVSKTKKELKSLNKGSKDYEKKKAAVKRLEEQLARLIMNKTDKEEGKEIALGTSKLNYLDPRISVAWCKKYDIPIEKVYNKTQRAKFRWALDMADKHFKFD